MWWIRAVHGGTHQVGRTGIEPDVFLINMLLVNRRRHKAAVGAEHVAAQLRIDGNIAHTGRHKNLLIGTPDTLTDSHDVHRLLIGAVRDADAAGEIHERDVRARLLVELHGKFKQDARERGIILVRRRVAGEESMDAERFRASSIKRRYPSIICSFVKPYLASPGLSMMLLQWRNTRRIQTAADHLRDGGNLLEKNQCV